MSSQIQLIADSFKYYVGHDLIRLISSDADLSPTVAFTETRSVIVSHGIETDPIFNYGNPAALALFELDWHTFTQLPSRYSAEALNREERAQMLEKVSRQGYVDDYQGVRVSSTWKRFHIANAYVWNLRDSTGIYQGQAAMFDQWTDLTDSTNTDSTE